MAETHCDNPRRREFRASRALVRLGWAILSMLTLSLLLTVTDSPATESLRGVVVRWRNFKFTGLGPDVRETEVRTTCADRKCVENTSVIEGTRGDSIFWHRREIWRLDKGVRWSLDLLARTWVEVDLQTEHEVAQAYTKMLRLKADAEVDLGEQDTIAGWPAKRYRQLYRDPETDSVFITAYSWIGTGLPGAGIRRSFDEATRRALGDKLLEKHAGADSVSPEPSGTEMRGASFIKEPGDPSPERQSGLADSLARAWRLKTQGRTWTGEEVMAIRETEVPEALFEIPAGFQHQALSQRRDFWPWEKAAKRPPAGAKRDPQAPPRLDPFAFLLAKRKTLIHPDPSSRLVRDTVWQGERLEPVDLEPENGFYHVKVGTLASPKGWVGDGWVVARDVKEEDDSSSVDVTASQSDLNSLVQRMNIGYKANAISSIRPAASRVFAIVGKDWVRLTPQQKKSIGNELSFAAGGGGVTVVFRDSVTSRTVATYRPGKLEEH